MSVGVREASVASRNDPKGWAAVRSVFATAFFAGLLLWIAALLSRQVGHGWVAFGLCYGLIFTGAIGWITDVYAGTTPGIKNHGTYHRNHQTRGWIALLLWAAVVGFYISKDEAPRSLAGAIRLVDPLSRSMRGADADQYFLYGFLYTVAVLLMGYRMLWRYRHNRYQIARTLSVGFCQLVLAFILPYLLVYLDQPEFYFTYFWPLSPEVLYPDKARWLLSGPGGVGAFMFIWATAAILVATPILTWRFGKRWYCSWVCGCGGLAETAGDPFRHLSSKRVRTWRFERWSIHTVLIVIVVTTILLWVNEVTGGAVFGDLSLAFKHAYKVLVVAVLAGWVGTGFYFVMGNRVWCRFFCPMAAILGLFQRFYSRFRITTNGDQCMSCGNCSTYCEMGIDVRSYAQRGANIVRASCVGCGICSAVCPRGVLNLECGPTHKDRFAGAERPLAEIVKSLKS